jgi:hypothetical protein
MQRPYRDEYSVNSLLYQDCTPIAIDPRARARDRDHSRGKRDDRSRGVPFLRRTSRRTHRAKPGVTQGVQRAVVAAGLLVALLMGAIVAIVPARHAYYADFSGLSPTETARRLTRYHGFGCEPLNPVFHDGRLTLTCSDSQSFDFYAELPCEESFACGTLEIDAACWRRASP